MGSWDRCLGPVEGAQRRCDTRTREARLGRRDPERVHDQIAGRRAAPAMAARATRPGLGPRLYSFTEESRPVAARIGDKIRSSSAASEKACICRSFSMGQSASASASSDNDQTIIARGGCRHRSEAAPLQAIPSDQHLRPSASRQRIESPTDRLDARAPPSPLRVAR